MSPLEIAKEIDAIVAVECDALRRDGISIDPLDVHRRLAGTIVFGTVFDVRRVLIDLLPRNEQQSYYERWFRPPSEIIANEEGTASG